MSYVISEISARSPDMAVREFAELVKDIDRNGQLVPIWVRGDEVIDGRKRLAACQRLGITPKVMNLDPEQDAEAVSRALNVLRTHYSPSQRAMYGTDRATATPADGQSIRHSSPRINTDAIVTVEQAARELGVSPSYVSKARQVKAHGAPEVVAAVKAGELTVHAAREIVVAVPKAEQPALVRRVVVSTGDKQRHTPVAKVLEGGGDARKDRAVPKPAHEQFARAVQSMEVLADVIAKNADEATRDARRKAFVASLRDIRTTITRAIHIMEITT